MTWEFLQLHYNKFAVQSDCEKMANTGTIRGKEVNYLCVLCVPGHRPAERLRIHQTS